MGTSKTVDKAGTEASEVKPEEETVDATATEASQETAEETPEEATAQADLAKTEGTETEGAETEGAETDSAETADSSGVGQGAGAVVAAALGVVSLTGSWVGTVASARQSLVGQLHAQSSQSSSVSKLLDEGYGNAWHATAMWGGIFALLALIIGVVVLARPAFGTPGRPQAVWIKSVAWGGVALGVIGLLLAVLKYTDVLLGLPSVS